MKTFISYLGLACFAYVAVVLTTDCIRHAAAKRRRLQRQKSIQEWHDFLTKMNTRNATEDPPPIPKPRTIIVPASTSDRIH